ncbi:UTRA domain-containing protein [Streptomyces sp. NPDC050535]|uniref:UTRA domain-containing protein n=1 Tax=Streptomyces sp. NPDC050535 TaxID=3365626 RepID=UPI0037951E8A
MRNSRGFALSERGGSGRCPLYVGKRPVAKQDADPEEAASLELPLGAPVMTVVHTARAEDGRVLEVSESTWPADRIVIVDEYAIEPEAVEPDSPSEV